MGRFSTQLSNRQQSIGRLSTIELITGCFLNNMSTPVHTLMCFVFSHFGALYQLHALFYHSSCQLIPHYHVSVGVHYYFHSYRPTHLIDFFTFFFFLTHHLIHYLLSPLAYINLGCVLNPPVSRGK